MAYVDNPHLVSMRYPFPKGYKDGKGRLLASIVIRETCEVDEETATKVSASDKSMAFHVALFHEAVCALSYVDAEGDVDVDAPDPDRLGGWPSRTRDFALRMFSKLNGVAEGVTDAAAEKAELVDPKRPRAK